jgi:hypothetical protein
MKREDPSALLRGYAVATDRVQSALSGTLESGRPRPSVSLFSSVSSRLSDKGPKAHPSSAPAFWGGKWKVVAGHAHSSYPALLNDGRIF